MKSKHHMVGENAPITPEADSNQSGSRGGVPRTKRRGRQLPRSRRSQLEVNEIISCQNLVLIFLLSNAVIDLDYGTNPGVEARHIMRHEPSADAK